MVALSDVIRRITIRASAEGVDATAAGMQKLALAEGAVAVASEQVSKATLSMETRLNSIQRRLDPVYRQEQDMAKLEKELAAARSQGLVTLDRQNALLGLQAGKYHEANEGLFEMAGGFEGLSKAIGVGFAFTELVKLPGEIAEIVHEAAGLSHVAETIGITTKQLQELQFAGTQVHVSTEDMTSGLERFAKNLGEAASGSGKLEAILKANHVTISGDLMKDLQNYANLIEHARNAEERGLLVTTAFGKSSAEMGNLFREGGAGIQAAADEADHLGAVISDDKLHRIEDLDKQYSAFTTTLGVKFKEAVVGAVFAMDDLLKRNTDLSNSLTNLYQNPSWETYLRFLAGDYAGAVGAFLGAPINQVNTGAKGDRAPITRSGMGGRFDEDFGASAAGVTKLPPSPGSDHAQKQFDDALKAADKQTDALKAQAESFNFTAGAAAEFQKKQELLNLAVENHIELSPAELRAVDKVAAAYGDATDALQHMKDAQQAQQFLAQSFYDSAKGATSLKDAVSKLLPTLADALAQAALLGQGPLAGIFGTKSDSGGLIGAGIGALLHIGGGGGAWSGGPTYSSFSALGNVFEYGRVTPYAMGGLVDRPTVFPMAGGMGLMGEAGAEAVMPLRRGPDGRLGVAARGGGSSIIINQTINVQGSSGEAAADARYIAALRREMKTAAREVIAEEMRPRGQLNPF